MKKIAFFLGLCFFVFSFSGCVQKKYRAELLVISEDIKNDNSIGSIPNSIECLGDRYSVEYDSHRFLESTGEKQVTCKVIGTENGKITIDEEGNIVGLKNIGNIGIELNLYMSETEIKQVVEKSMSELDDFSKYNSFSIGLDIDNCLRLSWQVERSLPCAIKARMTIDLEGNIISFFRQNECPEYLNDRFVSIEERDNLLFDAVQSLRSKNDIKVASIEVREELLSLYKSKPALICHVESLDINGFSYLDIIAIY